MEIKLERRQKRFQSIIDAEYRKNCGQREREPKTSTRWQDKLIDQRLKAAEMCPTLFPVSVVW